MRASYQVILNTGILYGKTLFTAGLTLYTTRIVLDVLGIEDYGIYTLIAGVISMLSFLTASMTVSTQRYMSYYQGKMELSMQKSVFSNSLLLHFFIGIILIIILEILSFFLFDGFLNIPENRIGTAKVVYQLMSFMVFFSVISVPFSAALNAHENMLWIAIITIIEVGLRLWIALVLYECTGDKLVYYAVLMAGVGLCSFLMYVIYSLKRYKECSLKIRPYLNIGLVKELGAFAGWNLFGTGCTMIRSQGITVVLNLFFGTVINTAYGIANQVSSQLRFFSINMLRALNPQIMKSEGADNRQRMLRLAMVANKFGFLLLAIVAIPCIFEMSAILSFWLKKIPENTLSFCCLVLIGSMLSQLTVGLQSALQATGKIKLYQVIIGSLLLLNLPVAFILLKFGLPANSVLYSYVVIELLAGISRIILAKKLLGLTIKEYMNEIVLKTIIPIATTVIVCLLCITYLNFQYRFLLTGFLSSLVFIISIYFTGLSLNEKKIVKAVFNHLKKNNPSINLREIK